MKKYLFVITLIILGMNSANAQTVWGARVGFSYPTVYAGKFGLEVGPVLYYSLKNNFYINTAAMFNLKSFEYDVEKINEYWLDIPLYIGYNFPVGGASLFLQTGPFGSMRISGNNDWNPGGEPFNVGAAAMIGININKFKIEVGYRQGFMGGDIDELGALFIGVSYVF